jgi:DNA polymerase-3 subunit gamma/tau
MYQVIARKYRPQSFAELIGQEHVRATLENAIAQRRIAHGYILSGQRGTGKTTVARIVARSLNCVEGPTITPCGRCASCVEISGSGSPDVIEIDAASNRGINEMRELRDNVRYRPARDRYKVFIIDEAHQITSEAFNALLKTLEEPPEWVVFILCTTEAHKIPTTIASRCQQFSFRSVDFNELIARMEWICAQEGIAADAETLAVLAQAGEGSVRDSLSALDQAIACCGSQLSAAEVRALLGMFSMESLEQVAAALRESNAARMLEIVAELERNGRHLQHFCRELARYLRNLLVLKIAGTGTRLVAASSAEQDRLAATASGFSEEDLTRYLQLTLEMFRELQTSLHPRFHLEIGLLKLVHAGRLTSIEEALAGIDPGPRPPLTAAVKTEPKSPSKVAPAQPRSGPSPFTVDSARKTAPPPPPAPAGPLKQRLHVHLTDHGMAPFAHMLELAEVAETPSEVVFTGPRECKLALGSSEMQKAVAAVLGRPVRVRVELGEGTSESTANTDSEEDARERALAHPEVRKFQELFPDSHIRTVRNLKE